MGKNSWRLRDKKGKTVGAICGVKQFPQILHCSRVVFYLDDFPKSFRLDRLPMLDIVHEERGKITIYKKCKLQKYLDGLYNLQGGLAIAAWIQFRYAVEEIR